VRKLPVQHRPARKLLGVIVAAALFLPDTGYTLGLGEIEVNSALNQKLNADIELLSATPEDAETIIVKLASRKEFSRAGLDRPYLLNDLRFKSVVINDVLYIKVSSGSPIREPFLNFLIEIDWPNGHLLREYTVLLDPPVFMTQQSSTAANVAPAASNNTDFRPASGDSDNTIAVLAPGVSVSSRPASTSQAPASSQASWIPAPVSAQQNSINQPAGSYKVKKGDTAWSLADVMRPDQGVTVPQMMIAMLRANPESFINGNVNGLKRGYILRIPDYNQITSISNADALALVREQAALWRQYQQSQSGGQPVSAMEADDAGASTGMAADSAAGRDVGSEDDAYLEIVSAGSGSSTISGKDPTEMTAQELRAELALARERVETGLVEKEALQQRVDSLQQDVESMQGMISIEDAELAGVQSLNMPAEGEPIEEAMIDESAMADADVNVIDEDLADMSAEAVLDEMDESTVQDEDAELAEAEFVEEGAAEDALFVDEALTEDESMAEMPEQVAPATDDFVATQPQAVDRKPADPLTQLLNDPMMLAAAGGGLLLFLALIGLIIKRRKAATETVVPVTASGFDDLEILADDIASDVENTEQVEQESPVADEESVDDADSIPGNVQDSAEDTAIEEADVPAEDEPRDDVIAEADVYLAYGIYQQAEELLTQAIADNPERDDYRVKLAETHFASKNADAFAEVASDIKQRVDDDASPAWTKVYAMGQELCANNPMFQGSEADVADNSSLSPDSPEMDVDLSLDEQLDEEPLGLPESEADAEVVEPVNELEFDLSDTGAVEEPTDTEDEFSLDIEAEELEIDIKDEAEGIDLTDDVEESLDLTDIDIGLDEETDDSSVGDGSTDVLEAAVEEDVADVDMDIDFGLVDTGADLEVAATEEDIAVDLTDEAESLDMDLAEEAESLDMDLTEEAKPLDMDLVEDTDDETKLDETVPDEAKADEAVLVASNDFGDDDDDFDLSSLDDVDEISTKLDLARAYLDMGDNEGTKGILEEVLADGDDEQKHEASELMAKLG
jgi:pilus assembly protein FimV